MDNKTLSGIKHWPKNDRPREKLLEKGAAYLTDSELLAILIRSGTSGNSAIDLARKVLSKFGNYRNMAQTDDRDWAEFKGLGKAKVAQIKAAIEIGRRFQLGGNGTNKQKIVSINDAVKIIMPQLRDLKTEVFKIICLNSNNSILDIVEITTGTVNQVKPIIREIFHIALQKFAAAIICVHNHPTGNPEPSKEDRAFTGELIKAGDVLQVKVMDHLIIGDNKYYSFADSGELLAYR